jgi:Zn-finger nucleic acid-binding protein
VKCPECNVGLVGATRHRLPVQSCPSCQGMWLEHPELPQLEDEVFDFGEHAKGTLVVSATPTRHPCPECGTPLQQFRYRFYDVSMELCPQEHGYWLQRDEDDRVLELMKKEEGQLQRKLVAEDQWAKLLRHMHSRSFGSRLRDLFRR